MYFKIFGHLIHLNIYKFLKNVYGLHSTTVDKKSVIFVDIDKCSYEDLKTRLDYIQWKYQLSDAYVFLSSGDRLNGNFHIWILDKMGLGQAIDILRDFDDEATKQYQIFSLRRGAFVLRFTPKDNDKKPRLIEISKGYVNAMEQSSSHAKFLEMYYGVKPILQNPDNLTKMYCVKYPIVSKQEIVDANRVCEQLKTGVEQNG